MGLRCLLGHDFGETEVEREREEDGDEMVVTIREVQTCSRCGTERVVSENKEVTAIRSPEDVGVEAPDAEASAEAVTDAESNVPASDAEATADSAETDTGVSGDHPRADAPEFEPPEDADDDDGVILSEADPSDRKPGEWPDADQPRRDAATEAAADTETPDPAARAAATDTVDAAETEAASAGGEADATDTEDAPAATEDEDVEFIDAEADDAPGASDNDAADADAVAETEDAAEAPESTEGDEASSTAWPDHGGEDEGFDAQPGGDEDVSFGGNGLTPDVEADDPEGDAEYVEADAAGVGDAGDTTPDRRDLDAGSGIAREENASVELSDSAERTGEFYCPNCGLTRPASGSSMRAGDICPECRKGYITERDA